MSSDDEATKAAPKSRFLRKSGDSDSGSSSESESEEESMSEDEEKGKKKSRFLRTDATDDESSDEEAGREEAERCAAIIGAAHTVPVHMKPGALFDEETAEAFTAEGKVIMRPGDTLTW